MRYRLGLSGEPLSGTIDPRLQGVGLIRSEYLCRAIGEYVTLPSCRAHIAAYVGGLCAMYRPHEVWYRTTELAAREVNVLAGADHRLEEPIYMLGLRGVRRGLRFRQAFVQELEMLAELSHEHSNLNVLLPFVHEPAQLAECLRLLADVGFRGGCGIMAEIPSTVVLLDAFLDQGLAGVTVGVNDLTTMTLGTYRGTPYHDVGHPAVAEMIRMVVARCAPRGVPVSVAGYVTDELHRSCAGIGVGWFVVHYGDLPRILGVPGADLPELGWLAGVKGQTEAAIARAGGAPSAAGSVSSELLRGLGKGIDG